MWAEGLTLYHAVFSISIPILLVGLALPARKTERWVGRRTFIALWVLFVANVAFGFLFLTPYRPPALQYLLALAGVLLLYVAARGPRPEVAPGREGATPGARAAAFYFAGLGSTVGFFALLWVIPTTRLPAPLLMLALGGWVWIAGWWVRRLARRGAGWSGRHQVALAAGALSFFIALAPLLELDKTRTDNSAGMWLVALVAAAGLAWLYCRVSREAAPNLEGLI